MAIDENPAGSAVNTGVAVVGFVLCFVTGGALMRGYDVKNGTGAIAADRTAGSGSWSDSDAPIPVDSSDPMWGQRSAPVTIVQFSDFQCPHCSRVESALDQVKTAYGPDKVRIIWKNEPLSFHAGAKPTAEAALGVFALKGADAFWKFHAAAFKNQGALNAENFAKWAQQAGVTDLAQFKAGLSAHKWAGKVERDHAQATAAGVNGTPAFFINGISLSGALPFDKFKAVIDQELQKAHAKIAAGTAKDQVYVAMARENKKAAPPPAPEDEQQDTKTVWKVPVGKSPVLGSDKALVTIVNFSDFECPFSKKGEDSIKKVREAYGDKVRLVWKNEPLSFHARAEPAAELALEARAQKGDAGFWGAEAKLFESAPKLGDADLEKLASDLSLNVDKVKTAIKEHKHKKELDADNEEIDEFQAQGTPHFFVNGRRLVGALPFEDFKKIIDEEIPKAQSLLAKGVKPAELYDAIIKDGKGAPELEKKTLPAKVNGPTKGNANAKVTIVEVSDFQCPFCKRVGDSMSEVMKNYGDKVKVTWRHMPLSMHPDAPLAAQAAQEAFKQKGSDGFWKMHDVLFENQKELKRESLEKYAQQIGLDMPRFKAALDSQSHKTEVDADAKVAADAGISGTPAFIINGYFINGAEPYAKFRKVIDRALAEAK
jgi:protein-disulfide isomerase